jgi:hypothetical protein
VTNAIQPKTTMSMMQRGSAHAVAMSIVFR